MPDIPTLRWPSQAALIPTRCPRAECRSRLIEKDIPYGGVHHGDVRCITCSWPICNLREDGIPRKALTAQELHPPRGRSPGRTPKPVPKLRAYKAGDTMIARLLDLLACGERMHRDDLCLALDVDSLHLRQIVFQLRERGHTIVTIRSDYLLLAEVTA